MLAGFCYLFGDLGAWELFSRIGARRRLALTFGFGVLGKRSEG
jgi:hypothetical protein